MVQVNGLTWNRKKNKERNRNVANRREGGGGGGGGGRATSSVKGQKGRKMASYGFMVTVR